MPINHSSQFAELTARQFELVGRIVVEWSNIEFLQKLILSRLLFSPEFISRTYTDRMSAARVQEAIKESVALHRIRYRARVVSEATLSEIEMVIKEITIARANRNKFAHLCWTRSTDEEIFGTSFSSGLPGSKKHRKSYVGVKNEELEQLHEKSYDLVDKLNQILERLPETKEEDLASNAKNQ